MKISQGLLTCQDIQEKNQGLTIETAITKEILSPQWDFIKDVLVPRNRINPYEISLFKKYKRKEVKLIELIKDAFLSGLSTRKVGEVLENVLGYKISAGTVSNIAKTLDSKVRDFHTKSFEDKYAYLFLDGINLNVKCIGTSNKRTVLACYGITEQGDRELILI